MLRSERTIAATLEREPRDHRYKIGERTFDADAKRTSGLVETLQP